MVDLLCTPSAVHFLSLEPLLSPIEIPDVYLEGGMIDWIIVGGESGPRARPVHPNWLRSLRDQCEAARVPFNFKQWGSWRPCAPGAWHGLGPTGTPPQLVISPTGNTAGGFIGQAFAEQGEAEGWCAVECVGKEVAGRVLDGRMHDEFPGETR
ncbi:MAG: DUF5131 family protein [Paraburkholderia sp.]|nr:MAG: DUF5131 family protein [Paraburkholderia sp.]